MLNESAEERTEGGILEGRPDVRLISSGAVSQSSDEGGDAPRESRFAHDFSRVPTHTAGSATTGGVQPKRSAAGDALHLSPGSVQSIVDRGTRGGGGPIPYRKEMESAFETDLGEVRAHRSTDSRVAAEALDAKAFTTGRDIVFRDAQPGKALVAHELTHVVQQSSGATSGLQGDRVDPPGSPLEREADRVGADVAQGRPAPIASAAAGGMVQRMVTSRQLELMQAAGRRRSIRVRGEGEDLVGLDILIVDRDYEALPADINAVVSAGFRSGRDYLGGMGSALSPRNLSIAGQGAARRGRNTMLLLLQLVFENGVLSHVEVARPPEEAEPAEESEPDAEAEAEAEAEQAPAEPEEGTYPRQEEFWDIRDGVLYILPPYNTVPAFPFPYGAARSGQPADISPIEKDRIRPGWATFFTPNGSREAQFARVEEITNDGIRVTWWHYLVNAGGDRAAISPDDNPPMGGRRFLERIDIGGKLSSEGLRRGTALIARVAPVVALSSVAVLAFFVAGPGAGVAGMEAAGGALEGAIIGGITGSVTTFLQEVTNAMLGAEDPAHFYDEANWLPILRRVLIGGITNLGAGISGSRFANFVCLNRTFVGLASSMLFNVLGNLLNMGFDETEEELVVRELRARMSSTTDPEEREALRGQVDEAVRRSMQQFDRNLAQSFWRDLFKEAISA